MTKGITFIDYTQAKEYADEIYSQGFMPDIVTVNGGYKVVVLSKTEKPKRGSQGLDKLDNIELPPVDKQAIGFVGGVLRSPGMRRVSHFKRSMKSSIPSTKGKHPKIYFSNYGSSRIAQAPTLKRRIF